MAVYRSQTNVRIYKNVEFARVSYCVNVIKSIERNRLIFFYTHINIYDTLIKYMIYIPKPNLMPLVRSIDFEKSFPAQKLLAENCGDDQLLFRFNHNFT